MITKSKPVHIIVSTQGPYGSRIASNLRKHAPSTWAIEEIALPRTLPLLIDDPEQFVPAMLPQGDLLIAASESPGAALLIPDLARGTTCRSIIAPIDNSMWLPAGLANQLQRELAGIGVTTVFPKPFCVVNLTVKGWFGCPYFPPCDNIHRTKQSRKN